MTLAVVCQPQAAIAAAIAAHEPRRQHGINRLEGGHRQGLAAVEPVINDRRQGVGKAEIGSDRDHQQIEHAKGSVSHLLQWSFSPGCAAHDANHDSRTPYCNAHPAF
jgi:hypothetical protein